MSMEAPKLQRIILLKSSIALILLLTILLSTPDVRCEKEEEQAITLLREVYSKLIEAEMAGADIRNASQQLNKALTIIKSVDEDPGDGERLLQEAITIIRDVDSMIPTLIDDGRKATFLRNLYMALTASSIASSIVLAYFFIPRIFWGFWLKARKHWIVRVTDKSGRGKNDRRRS